MALLTDECNIVSKHTIFDNFSKIGEGGFGTVYKAKHLIDNQFYAIKKIPLDDSILSKNIVKEVRYLAVLSHPNIIRYYHCWVEKKKDISCEKYVPLIEDEKNNEKIIKYLPPIIHSYNLCIQTELMHLNVSQYIELLSTQSKIQESKRERYHILESTIKAIAYLHSQKPPVIHCDIKPSNILIKINSNTHSISDVKLSDFGLITLSGEKNELLQYYGTPLYTDPSLVHNLQFTPNEKTDIFSLGILCFELLNIFSTRMETVEKISDFKNGKIFTGTILDQMIEPNFKKRPTIEEIHHEIKKYLV